MSTTAWTDPITKIQYPIGTEGLEHGREGLSGFILELFRQTYHRLPVQSILGMLLFGGSLDAAVPTYGLWAGPGWNAGKRTPEGGTIAWDTLPCYNENVKTSPTPENCYSLFDAITKTHDWRYGRLLKNAHMLCCAASVGVAAYTKSTPHFFGFARLAFEHF